MDVHALIPSPDPITLPWIGFEGLLTATFILHLVCMNAMLGSGLIVLAGMLRRAPEEEAPKALSTRLPTLIAFTINTGVAPLLFVHVLYGQFIFTSSVLMAVWWLSAVGLLLAAYTAAYGFDFKYDRLGNIARRLLLGGGVGLLLTIGFLFSTNMTLMLTPERWTRCLASPDGMLLNLAEPMLIPRYLHVITASLAVGGLTIAWFWRLRKGGDAAGRNSAIRQALRWFNGATAVQLLVGGAFLFSLPPAIRQRFLGADAADTGLLAIAVAGGVIALSLGFKQRLRACSAATLFTIIAMALVRARLRRAFLAPFFSPADLPLDPQYGPLILFLVAATAGGLAVIFMLHKAFGPSSKEGRP